MMQDRKAESQEPLKERCSHLRCCPSCKAGSSYSWSSDPHLVVGNSGASVRTCSCSSLSPLFQARILGRQKVERMTVKPNKGNFL